MTTLPTRASLQPDVCALRATCEQNISTNLHPCRVDRCVLRATCEQIGVHFMLLSDGLARCYHTKEIFAIPEPISNGGSNVRAN